MQTQAGESSRCRARQEGFPAVGQPQGLTLDGRDAHGTLSRLYPALSPRCQAGPGGRGVQLARRREGQKLDEASP